MGWRGEVRGPRFQEGHCAAGVCRGKPEVAACPDVKRSTLRPPAWGGERFLSGHFNGVLPPFGSTGGSGKKMKHGAGVKDG